MKKRYFFLLFLFTAATTVLHAQFADSTDAVKAAPNSHHILFENDSVRVLEVILLPGAREPYHTHKWRSLLIAVSPAQLHYYLYHPGKDPTMIPLQIPTKNDFYQTAIIGPEGLHAVENIDTVTYKGIRIEYKK